MSTDPSLPELRVLPDPEAVGGAAAIEIAEGMRTAIDGRGVAHWSTTGGSAAPPIYRGSGRRRCGTGSTGSGSTCGGATTALSPPTTRPPTSCRSSRSCS